MDIYESLLEANRLNITTSKSERLELQTNAITSCDKLSCFVELSMNLNIIGDKIAQSWQKQIDDMLQSLNIIVYVLIICAGMLAFIVLYNLSNINITERRRELATLKVLGFYDGEVSGYVYRENVMMTLLGIFIGMAGGKVLHGYVITTCEVDIVMFGHIIKPASFLYSGLLTVLFAVLIGMIMHFKLKKINMVESLKSIE